MKSPLINYIENNRLINVVFSDYFDTIVHRTVHPIQTLRIWAKFMIREFGLQISINALFKIRIQTTSFLKQRLKVDEHQIPYEALKNEVFSRLANSDFIKISEREKFIKVFELADIKSEQAVQYVNPKIVEDLKSIKLKGLKLFLISDYYCSSDVLKALLKYHNIDSYFDGVYSSCSLGKSKLSSDIYPYLLEKLTLNPHNVLMMGDNKKSDFINSKKYGLHAYLMPHKYYLRKNKINNLGNDKKKYQKVIASNYKQCKRKDNAPLTEYVLVFQAFIENLYAKCKANKVKDLIFLSREGLYLKKLFEHYAGIVELNKTAPIKTHYLRISRQASFQISFKPIEIEGFEYLKVKFKNLSTFDFLKFFNFSNEIIEEIQSHFQFDFHQVVSSFFETAYFNEMVKNPVFIKHYNKNRADQRTAFKNYINTFDINLKNDGIHLVDIGWGGTMQESIYKFFNDSVEVTGYYLGLKEIYNISPKTKRYGLIYKIYPIRNYSDIILDVNSQVYEQILTANHGSTLGYDVNSDNYTIEYHEPIEKSLYLNYIKTLQKDMLKIFNSLTHQLEVLCYDSHYKKEVLANYMLKIGLFQNNRDLAFMKVLNSTLFDNIGENKIGIVYNVSDVGNKFHFVKKFLVNPESTFRYFVKLRTMLYNKNKAYPRLFPMKLVYWYIRFNKFIKKNILKEIFHFKYAYIDD